MAGIIRGIPLRFLAEGPDTRQAAGHIGFCNFPRRTTKFETNLFNIRNIVCQTLSGQQVPCSGTTRILPGGD